MGVCVEDVVMWGFGVGVCFKGCVGSGKGGGNWGGGRGERRIEVGE